MAYEIKNNEIAWAPAVENINRGYRVFGVSSENSFKVLPFENMIVNIPSGGQCWINDIRQTWADHIQDNFEGGVNSWKSAEHTSLSEGTSIVFEGSKSLKMTWNHDGTSQFKNRIYKEYDSLDIKYRNKLCLRFYPVAAMSNDLYIKYKNNGSEFILTQISAASLTPGQWNRILVDLPANDVQKNKFQSLIFEFDGLQWNSGTRIFYFDFVEFDTHILIPNADPNNERKDLIVVGENGKTELVQGTPQSQNPVEPPDLPANKHALAIITVPAGLTTITNSNIFDVRIPNSFAVNADKTKNELTTIKGQIVQLALNEMEQNVLMSLPTEIPFTNMLVDKFWDRNGLNDTIELVNDGENMHGFWEAIDFPRGQVNVSGLPDVSGNSNFDWKTRTYYWKGKILTWLRYAFYGELGWGIASINPKTGAKIHAQIWAQDWMANPNDTDPTGTRSHSFYKDSGTWCGHPLHWTHDDNYLYIPVYKANVKLGFTSSVDIMVLDENLNVVKWINALDEANSGFANWYMVHSLQYVPSLRGFLAYLGGQRFTDWGHHRQPVLFDKNFRVIWTGDMLDTNYYVYGVGYIPTSGYIYQMTWRAQTSNFYVEGRRWPVKVLDNGDIFVGYRDYYNGNNNTNTNGYPRYFNSHAICNDKDRMWIPYRDAEYNMRVIYIEAGQNADWWQNYNIGDNVLQRGILVESNVESAQTNDIERLGYAVSYGSKTCFYSYHDKTYKIEGGITTPGQAVAAGSFSGRRGVSAMGKSSIVMWDSTNNAFYIVDYANAQTGREQIGFNLKTKTFSVENVKGVYVTAKVEGRGALDLLDLMKFDVLSSSDVPILENQKIDTYVGIPLANQPLNAFKIKFYWTPDGTKDIAAQFLEYGLFIDNEV